MTAVAVLAVVAVVVGWHYLKPAPPTRVTIATGPQEGAYYAMAKKYVDYFARNGVSLDVRPSGGSIENFQLLADDTSGVDLALVQAGTSPEQLRGGKIEAIASIYFEPVLLFYKSDTPLTQIAQLAGKKIAVGVSGSGVGMVARQLLEDAEITTGPGAATPVEQGGDDAATALIDGKIDAAFYVIAPTAPVVKRLLTAPGVRLMSFDHANAYGRQHPYLSPATLYRGSVDDSDDVPKTDVNLIATRTTLVAKESTHSAIIQLMVRAAQEFNSGATLLSDAGTFPNALGSELPTSSDAKFFLANPPNILHRTLPFWAASLIDRLIILVLPLLVILIPIFKLLPAALNWRVQQKLLVRYKRVRQIEQSLSERSPEPQLQAAISELTTMDQELAKLKLPNSSSKDLYDLRNTVAYVQGRLAGWLA